MFKKIISLILSLSLIITQPIFAQGVAQLNLTQYLGQARLAAIDIFQPTRLRYFSYDDINNSFRILLDKGDAKDIKDNQLKQEARELMDYFLIGLTLPNDTFWVNLRPDSQDNIIDPELEKTDLGRILLEADLQLKKDTAGLTSPQTPEGKAYWDKLYKKAGELFGTENITIPTITRPWIVPGEIIVRESGNSAYIYKANLKVMLESDYLIGRGGSRTAPTPDLYAFSDPRIMELNEYSSQIIRETIIPKLIQEVNSSKRYAKLRQAYYSLVLSRWFKQKYSSLRSTRASERQGPSADYISLIDSGNLANLTAKEPYDKLTYFKQYQESFAQGEYNLKETVYTPYGQSIRAYMSGGFFAGDDAIKFSGVETTVGSSIVEELFKNHNTVALEASGPHLQIKLSQPEQPNALVASPVTIEEMRKLGLEPPEDFIKNNIEPLLIGRDLGDVVNLNHILTMCKMYMLGFPGLYMEKTKIKDSNKIKEIVNTMTTFYFNEYFTERSDNFAVAAGYLSKTMGDIFNERIIAEGFENLQKKIVWVIEESIKKEESSREGTSVQEQYLPDMSGKASSWKDIMLKGFVKKRLTHDYLEKIFQEHYKKNALDKSGFLWLKTTGVRVINERFYSVVLERINSAGRSVTHRIFVESEDPITNVRYAIVISVSEEKSVKVILYFPSNKRLEEQIENEFGELSPDVLEDFEGEVMAELEELASSAIKAEDDTILVHKTTASPVEEIKIKAKEALKNAGEFLRKYMLSDEAQNKYNLRAEYIDQLEIIKLWLWLDGAVQFFSDRLSEAEAAADAERIVSSYKQLVEEIRQHTTATQKSIKEIYATFKARTIKSADDAEALLKALLAMRREEGISKEELDIAIEMLRPRQADRVIPNWKIIETLKQFSAGEMQNHGISDMQKAILNILIDDEYPGCAFLRKERLEHFLRYAKTLVVDKNYLDAEAVSLIEAAIKEKTYGRALNIVMNLSKEKMRQALPEEVAEFNKKQRNVDIDNSIPILNRIVEAYLNNKDSLLSLEEKAIAGNMYAASSAASPLDIKGLIKDLEIFRGIGWDYLEKSFPDVFSAGLGELKERVEALRDFQRISLKSYKEYLSSSVYSSILNILLELGIIADEKPYEKVNEAKFISYSNTKEVNDFLFSARSFVDEYKRNAVSVSPLVLEDEVKVILKLRNKLNDYYETDRFLYLSLSTLVSTVMSMEDKLEVNKSISKTELLNIKTELNAIWDNVGQNIKAYREGLADFYAKIGQNPGKEIYAEYAKTIKVSYSTDEIIEAAERAYKLVHGAVSPLTVKEFKKKLETFLQEIEGNNNDYLDKVKAYNNFIMMFSMVNKDAELSDAETNLIHRIILEIIRDNVALKLILRYSVESFYLNICIKTSAHTESNTVTIGEILEVIEKALNKPIENSMGYSPDALEYQKREILMTVKKAQEVIANQDKSSTASPLRQAKIEDVGPSDFVKGGIDFTDKAMKIGLERMGSFASSALVLPEIANAAAIDLDAEFKQIQLMASSGIRPSDERILEFEAACYYRGEFGARLGEITACLQQAHFLDERLGRESSEALRLATILPEVL